MQPTNSTKLKAVTTEMVNGIVKVISDAIDKGSGDTGEITTFDAATIINVVMYALPPLFIAQQIKWLSFGIESKQGMLLIAMSIFDKFFERREDFRKETTAILNELWPNIEKIIKDRTIKMDA